MFGGLGNIADLLKQAKNMKGQLDEVQSEMANQRYSADADGGAVTATVDGKGTLVDIKIKPESTNDLELLEDMIKKNTSQVDRQEKVLDNLKNISRRMAEAQEFQMVLQLLDQMIRKEKKVISEIPGKKQP